MPEQFVVPQFIEVEDRILGPLSVRQFLILLFGGMVDVLLFKLLRFVPFLLSAIPFTVFFGILALVKINGMPFHFFLLNLLQSFRKPHLRVWDKTKGEAELRSYVVQAEVPAAPPLLRKSPMTTSHLQELTLIANTGGVYRPDEERD